MNNLSSISSNERSAPRTRLHGLWSLLARAVWVALALLGLILQVDVILIVYFGIGAN